MPVVTLRIPESEARRLADRLSPSPAVMGKLAETLQRQVESRYATQGASGGKPWPPKRDGSPALMGLRGTWFHYSDSDSATVATSHPQAAVHQLGTKGKGGTLPTIRPTHASALFIPLSPNVRPTPALIANGAGGFSRADGARAGRDFIFRKKVDLPPRPQLPTSPAERSAQAAAYAKAVRSLP